MKYKHALIYTTFLLLLCAVPILLSSCKKQEPLPRTQASLELSETLTAPGSTVTTNTTRNHSAFSSDTTHPVSDSETSQTSTADPHALTPEEQAYKDSLYREKENLKGLVEQAQKATTEAERLQIRQKAYDLQTRILEAGKTYNNWVMSLRDTNGRLSEERQLINDSLFYGEEKYQFNKALDKLLSELPYDADKDFLSTYNAYRSSLYTESITVPACKKAATRAMEEYDKIKKAYEKGKVSAEDGVKQLLEIWDLYQNEKY